MLSKLVILIYLSYNYVAVALSHIVADGYKPSKPTQYMDLSPAISSALYTLLPYCVNLMLPPP